jgi:hypothetical protein
MTGNNNPVAVPQQQTLTLARIRARDAYHNACERLANASVAKHRADAEFTEAMAQYAEARGAAVSQGVVK